MFDTLFGMPLPARFIIAFVVVLALIGVTAWIVRRFAANRLGGAGLRGRQPRLAVIDAANIDARRRLILIRRDNIEHLLMIGGPSDVVVEPNIVRAGSVRESIREPARAENGARSSPSIDGSWPLQPLNEPPVRGRAEEPWTAPELPPRSRPSDPLGGLAADPSPRISAPDFPPPRHEPRAPTPAAPSLDPTADHNLAEMAHQLEAALRRVPETRVSASEAPAPVAAKPVEPPRAPRDIKMRIDPRIEARSEPKLDIKAENRQELRFEPKLEPKPEPKFEPMEAKPEPKTEPKLEPKSDIRVEQPERKLDLKIDGKAEAKTEPKFEQLARQNFYDNLEEEMASLLGRPPGKS